MLFAQVCPLSPTAMNQCTVMGWALSDVQGRDGAPGEDRKE